MSISFGDFLKLCDDSEQIVSLFRKSSSLTNMTVGQLLKNHSLYEDWMNEIVKVFYFDRKELIISTF